MWVSHVTFKLNAELISSEKCDSCHDPEFAPRSKAMLTDVAVPPSDASSANLRAFRDAAPADASAP
jgi:hypothetical protein